jgi:hypothetical protein
MYISLPDTATLQSMTSHPSLRNISFTHTQYQVLFKMLDPLSTLSLACNVFQVVSFAHESISLVKQIVKNGTPDTALAESAGRLITLTLDLQNSLNDANGHPRPWSKDELELYNAAQKCQSAANELHQLMEKVSSSRLKVLGVFLKSLRYKSSVERLEKELMQAESIMDTQVLVDSR